MDVQIYNKDTGALIGLISEVDFQFLVDQLEGRWPTAELWDN